VRARLLLLATFTALYAVSVPLANHASASSTSEAAPSTIRVFVQPGARSGPILALIRRARRSIRLEIYELTYRPIVTELGRATSRGLDVRVLLEAHPLGGDRSARLGYSALRSAGVPVRWANEGAFRFTHEKAMEIDGRVAGIFTSNLTFSGIFSNREFGVIDRDSTDAAALAAIFDGDWSRRPPRFTDRRLAVSPYNSRSDLDALIDGALRTLDLYAEEVADASIEAHLASAVRRHVRVRLITSTSSAGVDTLRRAGVAITLMPQPYVHAKAIVADGSLVFIGSENLTTTSLDQNREVGIVLRDAGAASLVERTFAADWKGPSGETGSPTPTTHGLHLQVTATPHSVRRGELLTITARTSAGAVCRVRVTYPDGYVSNARELATTQTADASGTVSWSWHVGTKVLGLAQATVSCTLGSASATAGTTFQVRSYLS
jgi:phosphatidylserine/phosphatidylglycerophosphate/cardiolipin synthase-like enzyme